MSAAADVMPNGGATARPPLRWVGGKSWLVDTLLDQVKRSGWDSECGWYFEPFAGGLALFWALRPQRAVLSDANAELMNMYRLVCEDVDALIGMLWWHHERYAKYGASWYYEVRNDDSIAGLEGAARTIFLNKTCFNGLYRVNRNGVFNVPHGRTSSGKPPVICDAENLRACSIALQSAERLEATPFETALAQSRPVHPVAGDLIYFDPEYDVQAGTSEFTGYTKGNGAEHQVNVALAFHELADRGVYVLASNADTPRIRELYHGFRMIELTGEKGRRNTLSAKSSSRGEKRGELLIIGWERA